LFEKQLKVSFIEDLPWNVVPVSPIETGYAQVVVSYEQVGVEDLFLVKEVAYRYQGDFWGFASVEINSPTGEKLWGVRSLVTGSEQETYYPNIMVSSESTIELFVSGRPSITWWDFVPPPIEDPLEGIRWLVGQRAENSTTFDPADMPSDPFQEYLNAKMIYILSPGYLTVYDSQNRVTGLVDGVTKEEEIPDSIYSETNELAVIFSPSETYRYEVRGTDEGTYGMGIISLHDEEADTFHVVNVPIASGTRHVYTVDWDALSQGQPGVTVQIDSDGDGTFERTITADAELTAEEFWPYSFEDSERGTTLRLDDTNHTFQFVTREKVYSVKEASRFKVIDFTKGNWGKRGQFNKGWKIDPRGLGLDSDQEHDLSGRTFEEKPKKLIIVQHKDNELQLSAMVEVNTDFCAARATDLTTGTRYLLLDKRGIEDEGIDVEPPIAKFEMSADHGRVPLLIRFRDKSSGETTSWLWDFGDGTKSSIHNPFHIYWKPGDYTVKLTVSGPGGDSTISTDIKVDPLFSWRR
jgi:PKD repeat protein